MLTASISPLNTSSKGKPDVLLWKEGAASPKHCYKATLVPHVATLPPAQKGSQLKNTRCHTQSTGMGPGTLAKDLGITPFFVKVCAGQLHIRTIVFRSFLDQHSAFQSTLHIQALRYTLSCKASGMNHCLSQCFGHSLEPHSKCFTE